MVTNLLTTGDFDFLDVQGDVIFGAGAELDFNFDAGFDASVGPPLTFLIANSLSGFSNLIFNFNGLSSLFTASVSQLGDSLFLEFSTNDVAVIPLPL